MKKLLYTLAFTIGLTLVGAIQVNAQLVSPVPLDEVFPTVRDSATYGVPGQYNTNGFAFSFTQEIHRCDCAGERYNIGAAAIQMCLNKLGFNVSHSGPGAPGMETNCFGHKTQVAMGSFQDYFGFTERSTNHYGEANSPYAGMVSQAIMNHLCYDIMNDNQQSVAPPGQGPVVFTSRGGSRNSGGSGGNNNPDPDEPSIRINKTGPSQVALGDPVTYSITVSNNGDELLSNVIVTDESIPGVNIDCGATYGSGPSPLTLASSLSVGASTSCNVDYTPTQLGTFTNVASVTADGETGSVGPVSNQHPVNVVDESQPGVPAASISKSVDLTTDADGSGGPSVGDTLTFTIEVCNVGAVGSTLPQVTVTDTLTAAGGTQTSFNAGPITSTANPTCDPNVITYTYTILAGDEGNTITNSAQITGAYPAGPEATSTSVPAPGQKLLSLTKTASTSSVEAPATINYTFVISNDSASGTTPITGIVLNDAGLSSGPTCQWPGATGELAQGQTVNCTGTYNATTGDAPSYSNTANVTSPDVTADGNDTATETVAVTVPDVVVCEEPDRQYIGAFDDDLVVKDKEAATNYQPPTLQPSTIAVESGVLPLWPGIPSIPPGENTLAGAAITGPTTDPVLSGIASMGFRFSVGQWKSSDTFTGASATDPICESDIRIRLYNHELGYDNVFTPWPNGCTYDVASTPDANGVITYGVVLPAVNYPLPTSFIGQSPYTNGGDEWHYEAYYEDPAGNYDADSAFKLGAAIATYDTEGCAAN